jgi:hypothetical protein
MPAPGEKPLRSARVSKRAVDSRGWHFAQESAKGATISAVAAVVDCLCAARGTGESCSDVILRLRRCQRRSCLLGKRPSNRSLSRSVPTYCCRGGEEPHISAGRVRRSPFSRRRSARPLGLAARRGRRPRINGKRGHIYAVPEGFQLDCVCESRKTWTYARRALSFARMTHDGMLSWTACQRRKRPRRSAAISGSTRSENRRRDIGPPSRKGTAVGHERRKIPLRGRSRYLALRRASGFSSRIGGEREAEHLSDGKRASDGDGGIEADSSPS